MIYCKKKKKANTPLNRSQLSVQNIPRSEKGCYVYNVHGTNKVEQLDLEISQLQSYKAS